MKYMVTFACGHREEVTLYGPTADRERRLEYFEKHGMCSECYKAAKDEENSIGCDEVVMSYREYKQNYADCKTKADTYDAKTKTIVVYVPTNR